ncbi:Coiled-coil domain-containing protein 75 [Wallemia ichthyophaga EXF-994]|uniref:Coiled-coil domain-containing protein 75 n=1 Tax=Wallemia ichthyophaga (strain EXF-994 / CBS 113033) TaxID=1299270 RepID=R9ASC1_WALI9|nr:Coiled-coil domain-containing protein 75 [Wallemia ichthyophaga EXF-994]EOR04945.1 Coiled-coil domain-containing protein 75 [Wallemia ichthyophaga EXF-994]
MDDAFLTQAAELEKKDGKGKDQTYGEMRLQALKQSEDKNMAGRIVSKKQRERETIEEGLERNIIKEAGEEGDSSNKALNMMIKMGFKPGQSLGKREHDVVDEVGNESENGPEHAGEHTHPQKKAHVEPVKPYFLDGRSGIGVQRVVSSKQISEAAAASSALMENQQDFRVRKTFEANARKSEGVLRQLRTTIKNADEDLEIKFNVFWINPYDVDTYPPFILSEDVQPVQHTYNNESLAKQLKEQMQHDKLRNEDIDEDVNDNSVENISDVDPEVVQQCKDFIKLDPIVRLRFTQEYAREVHSYCFWCGCKYQSKQDMNENCPGFDEDDH